MEFKRIQTLSRIYSVNYKVSVNKVDFFSELFACLFVVIIFRAAGPETRWG